MNCKTKDCNGLVFNEDSGYCQYCITESWSKKVPAAGVSQRPKIVSQPAEKVSLPINRGVTEQKSVTSEVLRAKVVSQGVTKLCSKCHKNPKSETSKSYCKECHAARVKKWRSRDKDNNRV